MSWQYICGGGEAGSFCSGSKAPFFLMMGQSTIAV